MIEKFNRNDKCPCGSGLKYKKCCLNKDSVAGHNSTQLSNKVQLNNEWFEKVSKLPAIAMVISEKGASSSLNIKSVSVTRGEVTTELLNDEIIISTNQAEGDKTENSFAIISIPQNHESKPEIRLSGNANIMNNNKPYAIAIINNAKKIKIKSLNGLFAIIKIVDRRDCGFKCFDILFGEAGREETKNSEGNKTRPHLTIFPDGNNKYFRLEEYKCKMESKLEYDPNNKDIFPNEWTISFEKYSEYLTLSFVFKKPINTVELIKAEFR